MNKAYYLLGLFTLTTSVFTACDQKQTNQADHTVVPAIDTTAMATDIRPQDDFYRYCNGGWMTANPLKDEYSRYGSFDILRDSSLSITKHILQYELADAPAGSDKEKARLLYEMAMDSATLNAQGAAPVLPLLARIDAIQDKNQLVQYLAESANEGDDHLVITYVGADEKKSDTNILSIVQPSLIMGDQDYYADGADFARQQEAYRLYIANLFVLAGVPDEEAKNLAQQTYDVEESLSKILYTKEEMRDSEYNYNKVDTTHLYSNFSFPYKAYFASRKGLEPGAFSEVNISQYNFTKRFDSWFQTTNLDAIKTLLKAYALEDAAPYLSDDFRQESFNFHGKVMSGAKEMKPRWKSAVSLVDNLLGEVVGRTYVEKHFPPAAKERMITMIDNLKETLSERIQSLAWMTEATKQKALEKLSTFTVKIGYPDKWEDFSAVEVSKESLYAYIRNISRFGTNKNVADLHKPVDKARWLMNPQTVNAYYNPTTNEICFPAAILQPPFFNMDADDAVNYGAIGVVIGHEITHGFDDQGRQYDKDGNMTNWWTNEDAEQFKASSDKLADQYSNILVAPGLKANGRLTLGENIADQGGLLISYQALMNTLKDKEVEPINGWTPAQRFFIAYGRIWGQNIRPEEIVRLTKIDPHSLGEYRVNQALKNIAPFYEAFNVKPGDPMYLAPEDRAVVW